MTTLEPGASEVFTHGLRCKPRSTALRASSPAPTMTKGFEVLVHDVMAATTTAPWSISTSSPSRVKRAVFEERLPDCAAGCPAGWSSAPWLLTAGASLAGNRFFHASLVLLTLPVSLGYVL